MPPCLYTREGSPRARKAEEDLSQGGFGGSGCRERGRTWEGWIHTLPLGTTVCGGGGPGAGKEGAVVTASST